MLARYSICVPASLLIVHPYPDCILIIVPVFELDNTTVPFLSYPFWSRNISQYPLYIVPLPLLFTNIYSIPALAGFPLYAYVYLR